MKKAFTDIFIRRPVLASVVSLLILLIGFRAYTSLNVRQFPQSNQAVVTVQTAYVGADADLVKGFVTTPLEQEIAGADGIDYIESNSAQGVSIINAQLKLNYPPSQALSQISAKVDKVRADLPEGAEEPTIDVQVGDSAASMYISFTSDILKHNEITDYLNRVVKPELSTVSGVEGIQIIGARRFAMRIWLKPDRLAAFGLTPSDVRDRLAANNFLAAVGRSKGDMVTITLTASTELHSKEEFEALVVKEVDGDPVRLGDIATVTLGGEDYATAAIHGVSHGDELTVHEGPYLGITVLPTANQLTVIKSIREVFPRLQKDFPEGLEGVVVYDATQYIEDAINEVLFTLFISLLIVTVVIYLFLGSIRTVAIPVIAMPLSLVGVGIVMATLGFSVNLLTLLALVLAIGLVVDDAIVMVENIHRHVEDGMSPFDAAIRGARELATPVIAMSLTLIVVYLPIGFTGGLTGSLFSEFAFTLAGAVFISGIVALTLSPMLCSMLLKPEDNEQAGGFAHWLDKRFDSLQRFYQRKLHGSLDTRAVTFVFAAVVLASCYFLFTSAQSELAPTEDQGILFTFTTAAPYATLEHTRLYADEVGKIYHSFKETNDYFMLLGVGGGGAPPATFSAVSGMKLAPWSERTRTQSELKPLLQKKLDGVAGAQAIVFERPPLPGAGGVLPVEFLIGTTQEPRQLYEVHQRMMQAARESGLFLFVSTDLYYDSPKDKVVIDREKAAALGITMRQLGADLATMLGGNFVNRFSIQGRSYKVIPQVERAERYNPDQLENYYTRAANGELVPLSSLVKLERDVEPRLLKRFQQLNSAGILGAPVPGVTVGQALKFLQDKADEILPPEYSVDYKGQSRQFIQEGNTLVTTFFFAIIIIFLVLAAQFESFRDPLIILITVPMSVAGALVFLTLGLTTINIYTQVGLITLIGLIAKHGILIVEFANQLQREEGKSKREAIEMASGLRLRPILMTTASTVFGVVPLIIATGAGAEARFSIGLVIAAGMSIGTLFTLFVVPAMYMLLGEEHKQGELAADSAQA